MLIVICFRGDQGGSFLDWSLHYLLGQRVHYGLSGDVNLVCDDPLRGNTAHGFGSNFIETLLVSAQLRRLEGVCGQGIRVLGLHPPPPRRDGHFHAWLDVVRGRGHGVICIDGPDDWTWRFHNRVRSEVHPPLLRGGNKIGWDYGHCRNMVLMRARDAEDRLRLARQTESPGRLREFLALRFDVNHKNRAQGESMMPIGGGFHVIKFDEWLRQPETTVLGLMSHLGLPVMTERLCSWRWVAARWSDMVGVWLSERNEWWDAMVRAVTHGHDHDCGGLSMMQEAMLIRDVLRSSRRMIRARHLERLPTNARDIHQLIG